MNVIRKALLGAVVLLVHAVLAAGPAQAGPASALEGFCPSTGQQDVLGAFGFAPYDELVHVEDDCADGWSIVVELWWDSRLRRTCWATKGAGTDNWCDFEIPEGKKIWFYIAQARRSTCKQHRPDRNCAKRRWGGAFVGYA
jgi:hypothetical protein